jgi:hypothetical protein
MRQFASRTGGGSTREAPRHPLSQHSCGAAATCQATRFPVRLREAAADGAPPDDGLHVRRAEYRPADGLSDQSSAEAYELIFMAVATLTIRGAFQAMMLLLGVGRTMMSEIQRTSKKVSMHSIRRLSWIAYLGCCCPICRCPVSGVEAPSPRTLRRRPSNRRKTASTSAIRAKPRPRSIQQKSDGGASGRLAIM